MFQAWLDVLRTWLEICLVGYSSPPPSQNQNFQTSVKIKGWKKQGKGWGWKFSTAYYCVTVLSYHKHAHKVRYWTNTSHIVPYFPQSANQISNRVESYFYFRSFNLIWVGGEGGEIGTADFKRIFALPTERHLSPIVKHHFECSGSLL